jgi:gliding motility-associated protein GldL
MLEEAKIDSELLESLAAGMRNLGENAKSLEGISSAVSATDSYVSRLQKASDKVTTLSDAYERASLSISGMTSTTQEGESFGEQMQKVSQNLAALNNVYELQLQGSSAHLEATQQFQSQVADMMANLSASVEDTKIYKENMALLSKNLTDLNNVYGNMLKAMTITRS